MEVNENIKPCLVTTPQGFSLSYKNKFLYSKYNPSKAIVQSVENQTILPGTVVLCCSAVLDYGLLELQKKLPENCILIRCEFEKNLNCFIKENTSLPEILIPCVEELYSLPFYITKAGIYKRVIRIDFSAGITFNSQLYSDLTEACSQAILTYWTNRLTLTKFGRRYSQNFFKNLKQLDKTTPIENYIGKISKPIIVCGAGQSLNNGINEFAKNRDNYFIICADTALQPLMMHKIVPDGVFIEEAQQIITKAFIGTFNKDIHIFAGLSSINFLSHFISKEKISFFTTEYVDAEFLTKLKCKKLLPISNKPFGSVGLTAVYYALKFRKSDSIPVYVYGLDFSYSAGITHAKGTLAHTLRLASSDRLLPIQNYAACFNNNSSKVISKDNNTFYTTPSMLNYSKMFNSFFADSKNLFDSSDCGITLNIQKKKPEKTEITQSVDDDIHLYTDDANKNLQNYFKTERQALEKIRDLLTGKENVSEEELQSEITELIKPREYLYLHFPDGNRFTYSQSFLNRVRTEIDFFLKIF